MTLTKEQIMALPLPPRLIDRLEQAMAEPTKLTERELDVLSLIAEGYDSQGIADVLNISVWTARTHSRRLRFKLGAKTRAHAVAIALRSGELA